MPFDLSLMSNLVVDIGNTNTKLAVFNKRELIHYQQIEDLNETILVPLIEKYEIKNATVSTVNKPVKELTDFLEQRLNYIPFTTAIRGEIKNSYETLATLGLDRWAKVIAAHRLFDGENCLMIDAGTCITYDLLNSNREYSGGSISLGIRMRFEALEQVDCH
jgi:type III pantothenate kinase